MGKRQHQKDKMYVTYTEWSQFYGGAKTANAENEHIKFKRLPYDHCAITIAPFEHPYCDRDGNCFELSAIVAFLKAFKMNPITGQPQDAKSLVKLRFHRNGEDGSYQCPSLFKPFTKNSHIVAVATTGNVFSWEAIEQLNIKTKNWKDLVDDTPFTRKDLITLQDPNVLEKFNISTFHYIRKKLRVLTEEERRERSDPQARLKSISAETRDILSQLERDYKPAEGAAASTTTAAASGRLRTNSMQPIIRRERLRRVSRQPQWCPCTSMRLLFWPTMKCATSASRKRATCDCRHRTDR